MFRVYIRHLGEDDVAKDAARKYLQSPEPEKSPTIFAVCLRLLGQEDVAKETATRILESPIEGVDNRIIYAALQIASETEKLDIAAEGMVRSILEAKSARLDETAHKQYYLYLQIMKVPLFRVKLWQAEVDKILQKGLHINRNLFYSLTLSHINKPDPLTDTCLLFIRNWRQEFKRQKRYWGYFIRSLAHPILIQQPVFQKEICQLCRQMLLADSCPSELKGWLQSIIENNKFPLWKSAEEDEL